MRNKTIKSDLIFDLINAFKSIRSVNESASFLQDILTAREIRNMAVRLRVAKLILSGEKQRDISFDLKISIATVTKVNAWLNQKGEGFKQIISRLPAKYDIPTKPIRGPLEYHLPEIIVASIQYGIAKTQDKKIERLIKNVKEKKDLDKDLKEVSDDFYKHKGK
ncbi:MAG: YerC/YecD family TrpR-related protein [bacterium]|nr:YerC/YecD family TrpR-related protein [bacterium]